MPVRLSAALTVVMSALLLLALSVPAASFADPASDLAAAQEEESAASANVAAADAEVKQAEKALEPVEKKANAADEAAEVAESEAAEIKGELESERTGAAEEVEAAEANYDGEKSTHDTTTAIGFGIAGLSLLIAVGAFIFSKVQKWPFSKRLTQVAVGGLGVLLLIGLGIAFIPSSPQAPEFSDETMELAADAQGDPADPPTDELTEAEEAAAPLITKAKPLAEAREEAEDSVSNAESKLDDAKSELNDATSEVTYAQNVVEREERKAEKEAAFREEATAIDYDQLIKNPYRYEGEKVVYTGQIFQIQEGYGGFMLLSVTDEGYGFWTDEIYVTGFGEIESAEEDSVTVYGTVTGAKEYATQGGGTNYVPQIKAKYVDE